MTTFCGTSVGTRKGWVSMTPEQRRAWHGREAMEMPGRRERRDGYLSSLGLTVVHLLGGEIVSGKAVLLIEKMMRAA